MSVTSNGPKGEPEFASSGNAPTFASDLTEVSRYAAEYGNHTTGTTAERTAFTGDAWEGLHWYDEDLEITFQYGASGAWLPISGMLPGGHYRNTTQTMVSGDSWFTILYNETRFQRGVTQASGVVTIPYDGVYLVQYSISYAAAATGQYGGLFSINGVSINDGETSAAGGSRRTNRSDSIVWNFNTGDTVSIKGRQNSGSTLAIPTASMGIQYLSPL